MKYFKANELSIGDWMKSTFYPFPVRIVDLKTEDGYGWVKTTEVLYGSFYDWKSDASLTPIIITEEILRKNGFEVKKIYKEFQDAPSLYFEHKELNIVYDYVHKLLFIKGRKIRKSVNYVNELQYYLRRNGLGEFAKHFAL